MIVEGTTIYDAWVNQLRALLEHGVESSPRDQRTKEVLGLQLRIRQASKNVIVDVQRKLNYKFLVGQWLTTSAGVEDHHLARYNSKITSYEDDGRGGKYPSYGPRLLPQWPFVLKQLMDDRNTRQAVASIWEAQHIEELRYVPCTLSLQFLLRPKVLSSLENVQRGALEPPLLLHTVATMRSSDAWLGIPYDAFNFSQLANILAGVMTLTLRRKIYLGDLVMNLGSSHLYEQHWETARSLVNAPKGEALASPLIPSLIYSPLIELQMFFTQKPTPLPKDSWKKWPWPYNEYAWIMESENNMAALEGLRVLSKKETEGP